MLALKNKGNVHLHLKNHCHFIITSILLANHKSISSSFNIGFQLMKLGIHLILYLIERTNKTHVLGTIIEELVTSGHFLLAFY